MDILKALQNLGVAAVQTARNAGGTVKTYSEAQLSEGDRGILAVLRDAGEAALGIEFPAASVGDKEALTFLLRPARIALQYRQGTKEVLFVAKAKIRKPRVIQTAAA